MVLDAAIQSRVFPWSGGLREGRIFRAAAPRPRFPLKRTREPEIVAGYPCCLKEVGCSQSIRTVTRSLSKTRIVVIWDAQRLAPAPGTKMYVSISLPHERSGARTLMECAATVSLVERMTSESTVELRIETARFRECPPGYKLSCE